MKKLLVLIVALALLLGLAGCGGGSFAITYDSGSYGSGEVAAGKKIKGEDFTLSSETFTRDGYIQTGWSTSDGGTKAYDLGGKYTNDANIILYPVWMKGILPGTSIGLGGIYWLVLEVRGGKALVISDEILETRAYNGEYVGEITWENCSLRGYLNGEFFDNTFSAAEKEMIVPTQVKNDDNQWFGTAGGNDTSDKIFLLSLEEVVKYFGDSGQLANRPGSLSYINDQYNSARIAKNMSGNASWWWLRSPGLDSGRAAYVNVDGRVNVYGGPVNRANGGVRPALWINLEKLMVLILS
ncbi:MAG: InlB B-repeat-containing protein [Clostridiales bacterium]|nr:InlB B-repeat-containing protein [Clostridiales bacterium]